MLDELYDALYEYAKDAPEVNISFLHLLIDSAIEELVNYMYPYGVPDDKLAKVKEMVIKRYKYKILYIAEYHFDKQGKEGVILYSENDTSAHFESSGTPRSYFTGVIPFSQII